MSSEIDVFSIFTKPFEKITVKPRWRVRKNIKIITINYSRLRPLSSTTVCAVVYVTMATGIRSIRCVVGRDCLKLVSFVIFLSSDSLGRTDTANSRGLFKGYRISFPFFKLKYAYLYLYLYMYLLLCPYSYLYMSKTFFKD